MTTPLTMLFLRNHNNDINDRTKNTEISFLLLLTYYSLQGNAVFRLRKFLPLSISSLCWIPKIYAPSKKASSVLFPDFRDIIEVIGLTYQVPYQFFWKTLWNAKINARHKLPLWKIDQKILPTKHTLATHTYKK